MSQRPTLKSLISALGLVAAFSTGVAMASSLDDERVKTDGNAYAIGAPGLVEKGPIAGLGAAKFAKDLEHELSKTDGSDHPYGGYPKAAGGRVANPQLEHFRRQTDGEFHPLPVAN
ncbi:hypothetical protein [Pelomicrobium sp. G1]|uniref:hypothetical protein n=1 Tax=unclassified Pelomicrobium TaxID=2815318 RepID=UPI003482A7FA